MSDYLGGGPDGQNLLGFLSAVGTLAMMELCWPKGHPRMRWEMRECWRPVWSLAANISEADFVAGLHDRLLARRHAPEFNQLEGDRLPADDPEFFAALARAAAECAKPGDRTMADFTAAFASEVQRNGVMQDTALRTTRSHEFLRSIRELHEITIEQVREMLFGPWGYRDRRPTLRYDVTDDRRGALRASDPSKADIWTVRGANALASEALRFFWCAPGRHIATTGFCRDGGGMCFTWPIWIVDVGPEILRSLLNLTELLADRPNRAKLGAIGVVEMFRSWRVNNDRYRNFTPAVPV
jgi:hypothetical protein